MQPVQDKAEVSIDFPDKFYMGSFQRSSKFEARSEDDGLLIKLVRPGGLVAIDNTLWGGRVADESDLSASTRAIRAFNETLHADERIDLSLVPIGDGLTLARKRD